MGVVKDLPPQYLNLTGVKEALNRSHKYISKKNEAVRSLMSRGRQYMRLRT